MFEEHLVRRTAGYKLDEWRGLSWQERALEVAMRRIEKAIEAFEIEAQNEKVK